MKPEKLFKKQTTTGTIIKSWREAFKVSQKDMSYACKMPQSNLSGIENDSVEVGSKVALKLAAYMGLNPLQLLFPNGYENESDFIEVEKRKKALEKIG